MPAIHLTNPASLTAPIHYRYVRTLHRSDHFHAVSLANGGVLVMARGDPPRVRWVELPAGEHATRFRVRVAGCRQRWRLRPDAERPEPGELLDRLCARMLGVPLSERERMREANALRAGQRERAAAVVAVFRED